MRVLCLCLALSLFILCSLCPTLPGQSLTAAKTAAPPSQPEPLKLGEPVKHAIAPGETHAYTINLTTGQYLHLEVVQERLPFAIRVLSADGKELERRNPVQDTSIPLSFVAPDDGSYRIEIRFDDKDGGAKDYDVKVDELRPSEPDDQKRVSAERADNEGDTLRLQGTGPTRHEAMTHYEISLALWSELKDQKRKADTLSSVWRTNYDLGELNKALDYWNQELTLRRALGDPGQEGEVLGSIATAYSRLGDRQKALEAFSQSLEKVRAAGDKTNEGLVLGNIGLVYFGLGQIQTALDYFQQALPLEHGVGSPAAEAATLGNMGTVYSVLGEPQKALDFYRRGLQLELDAADLNGQAAALSTIASLYWQLGEWEHALESQKSALEVIRKAGDHNTEAIILNNMGTTYRDLGQLDIALKYHLEALPVLHAAGLPHEATALQNIGLVYRDKGDFQKALEYYQQASKLFEARHNSRGAAQALTYTGEAYLKLGQARPALDCWNQALPSARSSGDRVLEASVLTGVAKAQIELGRLDEAQTALDSALALTETLRTAWVGADLRAYYSSTVRDRYQLQIELLMRQHQEEKAFEASERERARSLLELLTESQADIREGVDPALLAKERSLQASLRAKSEQRIRTQNAALEKDIDALTAQYHEVEAQIRSVSPRYAALTQPQPLSLAEIQKQVLDPDTLLLEYALGEERSFLWAVTPNSFTTYELPGRSKLEAVARQSYEDLSSRQPTANTRTHPATLVLSRTLLTPVASQLGKKRLVVVTEGALQYIPFAALPSPSAPGSPLIADHEVVSLPSASTAALLRRQIEGRKTPPKLVAVLADPVFNPNDPRVVKTRVGHSGVAHPASATAAKVAEPENLERSGQDVGVQSFERLLASRREADTIVALAGKDRSLEAVDFDASRQLVASDVLGQYRYIHIATHGLLNSRSPELSGLVFSLVDRSGASQNGFLEAQEIYNLKLGADLVVLSACQTALGKEIRGEGLVSLSRGFMYAGAPRVIASLWKVPDQATTQLMESLYRGILKQGLQPAAALRAAQYSMWKQSRRSSPYYWAGFTLQGEWQ
jgi:CHAT domain-containing protein/Tfp pilus assembly protein PilF